MEEKQAVPKRLYKYRTFDARTLESLVDDKVYYANPNTFNDPLDSRPSLQTDLSLPELEAALRTLVESRVSAEMKAAAETIKYRGPKTMDHIEQYSRRQAKRLLATRRSRLPRYEPRISWTAT